MGRFRVIVVTRMNSISILERINSEYVYIEIHVVRSLGGRYFFEYCFEIRNYQLHNRAKMLKLFIFILR